MWVRFLKSKDATCAKLETILHDARHTHAHFHSHLHAFAPFLKFDSDSVFEAANTQLMCMRLGFSTQFSVPYAHHMLGKAERPWRTLRDCASSMLHAMSVPNNMWSCAIITVVHLRNAYLQLRCWSIWRGPCHPSYGRSSGRVSISSVWVCGICQST
jgi:hypothetical protein